MISLHSIGTVNPTEQTIVMQAKYGTPSPRGFLYCHGAGGSAQSAISDYGNQGQLCDRLTRDGLVGLATDLGGEQTWANDTAMSRTTDARTYLNGTLGATGKTVLIGGSMGGAGALVWASRNPTLVACVVVIIPVVDITDIHANNRAGLAPLIDGAYSGGWSQATYGAAHNPLTMARDGAFDGIPILGFYGTTDTLCVPEAAQQFAVASGAEMRPIPFGHEAAAYAAATPDEITAFIAQHT